MKNFTKTKTVFSAIKNKITGGELVKGDKLSPVLILAKEFDVSTFTIIKAFERLEKENLITRVDKSGVYVGIKSDNKPISCKKVPAKTRAEEIADSIISQIIQGTLKVGEYLTLKKVLTFKYAASKETINKTIEILIERKYIRKNGFRYAIGKSAVHFHAPAKNRVYILANENPDPWEMSLFPDFERELQMHGVTSFEILNLWNEPDLINKVDESTTAGFLMNFDNLRRADSNQPEKLLTRFCKTAEIIEKKKLSLVVDSYNGILRFIPNFKFKPMPNVFFIGYDEYEAGEKLGAYLASMGHKQIAYFNFGISPWTLERFKGVESELKRLFGLQSNVYHFQVETAEAFWSADLSTYGSTSPEKKKRFLESYSGLFDGYTFHHRDPVKEIYPSLANRIFQDIYSNGLASVFEKALEIKEITAWVGTGASDTLAAAEFLMEQKISIPDKISLIGFASIKTAIKHGITVYDFMEGKAGYLAAHCILGDIPIKENRKGYVEYEGQIMVRKSVKAI
jgi:DNA-binding transcriptional regulator YhcF (GntR family)